MEEVKQIKAKQEEIWTNNQRFQSQYRQDQERLAKEIKEQEARNREEHATSYREAMKRHCGDEKATQPMDKEHFS
ncbi:hypothetical protein PIB30_084417 [Stylosanthes scabra]|uniref:Uncharacterized protein n=1 Tax=Stylosanthes scabra TaxID=79078 RepID=A0ABU6ST48_9FABA|nr:hypothetical protein [Stylosanthes scabra]